MNAVTGVDFVRHGSDAQKNVHAKAEFWLHQPAKVRFCFYALDIGAMPEKIYRSNRFREPILSPHTSF